jgi:hypothetical protein
VAFGDAVSKQIISGAPVECKAQELARMIDKRISLDVIAAAQDNARRFEQTGSWDRL